MMKPLLTAVTAVAAVPLLATAAYAGKPTPAPGTTSLDRAARVSILSTPDALEPRGTSVNVTVTYSCKNTRRTTHYLSGQVLQPGAPRHVIGYRGDYGGTLAAICTGKPVTQRLAFQRSAYWESSDHPTLQPGLAELTFTVEARGTFGYGAGWYAVVGPGASVVKTVSIPHVHESQAPISLGRTAADAPARRLPSSQHLHDGHGAARTRTPGRHVVDVHAQGRGLGPSGP